jgi:hypothetical protein
MIPKSAKTYEISHYERFLTQHALDSIRLHNGRLLENVEIELVIEDDQEFSDR